MKRSHKMAAVLATAALMTTSALMFIPACAIKTKHPRVAITVECNNVSYTINYKLYRNMYPQTVQHFIELADNGYYNDTIIHDYRSGADFVGGLYQYDATSYKTAVSSDSSDEQVRTYLTNNYKYDDYSALYTAGKMTYSVYKNVINGKADKENPVNTLMGEFSANDHKIENGALSASFGSLKMVYYTDSSSTTRDRVAVTYWDGTVALREAKYNSATSAFSMQMGTTSTFSTANYAVFGKLWSDSDKDKLNELLYAIDVLKAAENFETVSVSDVENTMEDVDDVTNVSATFTVAKTPIVIKSVKVKKY